MEQYIDKVPTREEALALLKLKGSDTTMLFAVADKVREKYCGNKIHACTITNAKSGKCKENCRFCAQSAHYSTNIPTYDMKDCDTMQEECNTAGDIGSDHFGIVTSGREVLKDTPEYNTVVEFLNKYSHSHVKPCASLGMLTPDMAEDLKSKGLTRYHNNIQTSPSKYGEIVATTHTIEERIASIKAAKNAGLEVCSGGIIGMGETLEDRIDMAYTLLELGVDSVPINVLNPIKGTPMGEYPILAASDILKTIAVFRIILKDKVIKVAAGRESILKDFMGTAFLAGANGLLIGGYLTVRGRSSEEDQKFIENIERIWNGEV